MELGSSLPDYGQRILSGPMSFSIPQSGFEGLLHACLGKERIHRHPQGRMVSEGLPGPGEDPSPGKPFLHDPVIFILHWFSAHRGMPEDDRFPAVAVPGEFSQDPALGRILLIDRASQHGGQSQDHRHHIHFIAEVEGTLIGFQGVFVPTDHEEAHNFYSQPLEGPDIRMKYYLSLLLPFG